MNRSKPSSESEELDNLDLLLEIQSRSYELTIHDTIERDLIRRVHGRNRQIAQLQRENDVDIYEWMQRDTWENGVHNDDVTDLRIICAQTANPPAVREPAGMHQAIG